MIRAGQLAAGLRAIASAMLGEVISAIDTPLPGVRYDAQPVTATATRTQASLNVCMAPPRRTW
jgi:hypothetical protein